jgi:hypothetical protein
MYNAAACSIEEETKVSIRFRFDKFEVYLCAGDKLKHPVFALKLGPPIPKEDTFPKKISRSKGQQVHRETDFPADFYVEIIVVEFVDVENEVAEAVHSNNPSINKELTSIINQKKATTRSQLTISPDL